MMCDLSDNAYFAYYLVHGTLTSLVAIQCLSLR